MNSCKLVPGTYIPVVETSWSFRELVGQIARQIPSTDGEYVLFVEAEEELGGPPVLFPAMFRRICQAGLGGPIKIIVPEREEEDVSFILLVAEKDSLRHLDVWTEAELQPRLNRSPHVKQYLPKKTQKPTAEPAPEESRSSPSVVPVRRSRRVIQRDLKEIRAASEVPSTSSAVVQPRKRQKHN